jgi:hypothetical protein
MKKLEKLRYLLNSILKLLASFIDLFLSFLIGIMQIDVLLYSFLKSFFNLFNSGEYVDHLESVEDTRQ